MQRRSFLSICVTALFAPLALLKREPPATKPFVDPGFTLTTFSIVTNEPGSKADVLASVIVWLETTVPLLEQRDVERLHERMTTELGTLRGMACIADLSLSVSILPTKRISRVKIAWSDGNITDIIAEPEPEYHNGVRIEVNHKVNNLPGFLTA